MRFLIRHLYFFFFFLNWILTGPLFAVHGRTAAFQSHRDSIYTGSGA
jgi:hypothetical protein